MIQVFVALLTLAQVRFNHTRSMLKLFYCT